MNISKAMEQYIGPKAVIGPDEGTFFYYGKDRIEACLKFTSTQYKHFKYSSVRYTLQPGQTITFNATMLSSRMLYCIGGKGEINLNSSQASFFDGVFVHVGEGHSSEIINTGSEKLYFFSFVFGPSFECRLDLAKENDGNLHLQTDVNFDKAFGFMNAEEANSIPEYHKGVLSHQLPDSGPSYWQANPTAGWVEVKLAPFSHDVQNYAVLMQTLYPGSRVREHAHNQLNELILITKGTALAALDNEEVVLPKGSILIIGRNVWHWWRNANEVQEGEDAQNFALIDPPGVEGALALTGRERTKGETWPTDIVRNAETGKILHERFGFLIRAGADAVKQ